jgi:transposase-like protein
VTLTQIARELGVRADLLRRWVRRAQEDAEPGAAGEEVVTVAELKRLQRENETLRQEAAFAKNWSRASLAIC